MTILLLLLALPAAAQVKTAPVSAPLPSPVFAPLLATPSLSPSLDLGAASLASGALSLVPAGGALALPAPALAAPIRARALAPVPPAPTVISLALPASALPAASAPGAQAQAAPAASVAALRAAAPSAAERGAGSGSAQVSARFDAVFDGRGKLAERLAAPGAVESVDLSRVPTAATPRVRGRKQAASRLERDLERITRYQEMLFARGERAVLLVFQGMDTGGKDGVIKAVVGAMNPQGVRVASFKKPTEREGRRHYLWRIKKSLPEKGGVAVFNRSHYEDIVMPTVLETLPAAEVELRYDDINHFEEALADKGVVILKFFLHISKGEQKRRLQARLDDPEKNWKFSPSDLEMRGKWAVFQRVWGRVLASTNKPWAPWYIIPADNKWYRDYAVGRILRQSLRRLGLSYPPGPPDPGSIVIPD